MSKTWRLYFLCISALSMMSSMSYTATLFVESLDDTLGSTATLRQTILNATSGDTIQFNVSGTITLDEVLGQLVVDKQLIIDGQNKIVIDGADLINVCFFITGFSASSSEIKNITIQSFNGHNINSGSGTVLQELPAHGILIDPNAGNCSIITTTIKNINSGIDQNAAGINSAAVASTNIIDTTITLISSEDNTTGNSGSVRGVNANILGNCTGNSFSDLTSGTASDDSGAVLGIQSIILGGDCANNTLSTFVSGAANNGSGDVSGIFIVSGSNCLNNTVSNLSSGTAGNEKGEVVGIILDQLISDCLNNSVSDISGLGGIRLSVVQDGGVIACNTVCRIMGEDSNLAFGIEIESGDQLTIHDNSIDTIENNNNTAHGFLLGGVAENTLITNSDISNNVILNIYGGTNDGFGITIINDFSIGNTLLRNSISRINSAAINYETALTDGVVDLSLIECSGQSVTISGTIIPEITSFDTDFLLQFFVSTLASPSQAKIFIGEQTITAGDGPTPFNITFEPSIKIFGSQFVTATATALPGSAQNLNTSVVSNALFGCTSSIAGLCNIVSICPNDDSIPMPECPVPEACESCAGNC